MTKATHAPKRRRGGRRGVAPVVAFPIGWWLFGLTLAAVWRFLAGQVVLRRPGLHDSRWRTWAPPVPEHLELSRTEGVPRSTWARRPGWHRQVVRLAAIALLIGLLAAPAITVASLSVAIVVGLVRSGCDYWQRAYYHRVCSPWLDWLAERLGWEGVENDPRTWIELPPHRAEWAPVAPLRAALLRTGDESQPDGWLARHAPKLAARLEPMAAPIAEQRWVRWLLDPPARRRPLLAVAGQTLGRALVATVEASRMVRVRPRLKRPDLANADSTIVIHYPPGYQAHETNLAEVQRVVTDRLPEDTGTWKLRADHKALTLTAYHPTSLPRRLDWTREVFAKHSLLNAPIGERPGGDVMSIDLKGQTPHVNASGRTGSGKTITFLVLIGNFLYHGGRSVICDPKRIDFVKPFRGLRNVDLVTVEDNFPRVLEDLVAEMDRRYKLIEEYTVRADELGLPDMGKNAELYFQPVQLCIDEKSRFTAKCKAWWRREGGGFKEDGTPIAGKGDPITVEWERDMVARARAAAMYVMAAAQQNSIPNTFPDTDIRGNYQYKILSGPADGPGWVVTFPGERKRKLSSQVKGRAIVGIGSELHETQLAYMDWEEVRAAAQHGEQIMDAENRKRAEMLATLTGRPLWEVSPLPWWVPVPAETAGSVQGQDTPADTPQSAPDDAPDTASTTEVESAGQGTQHGHGAIFIPAQRRPVESHTSSNGGTVEDSNNSSSNGYGGTGHDAASKPTRTASRICGNRAAARHLGITQDRFMRARTRAKERGEGDVPGITRDGTSVVYDATKLAEWWNQRPGSGRKAS